MSRPDLPPVVASPCSECPWRKSAVAGYLGPHSAKEWVRMAHGETAIACHKTIQVDESWEGARQCAGSAAFRANVCKRPRDPNVASGPPREDVFSNNEEFVSHHTHGEQHWQASDMWNNDEYLQEGNAA